MGMTENIKLPFAGQLVQGFALSKPVLPVRAGRLIPECVGSPYKCEASPLCQNGLPET